MNLQKIIDATPTLSAGAHEESSGKRCLMEAVAFVMGEPHSDKPECTCPVIAAFCRRANDSLPGDQRNRLWVVFEDIVGTVSPEHEQARASFLAMHAVNDWAVRACRGKIDEKLVDAMANARTLSEARVAAKAAGAYAAAADAGAAGAYAAAAGAYAAAAGAYAAAAGAYAAAAADADFDLAQEYIDAIRAACAIGKENKQPITPVRELVEVTV